MEENVSLGRIAGIHVGANWSVIVVAALIAWSLATGLLPASAPGQSSTTYWVAGIIAAIVFLASLLAHELAHSVAATRFGIRVYGITLWLFGGVSRLGGEASTPGRAAIISFVGPLTSLVLGVLFLILGAITSAGSNPGVLAATLSWLGAINILLGIFNLIPAAPLDGGRLLHALVWARTGDSVRATTVASWAGRIFGYLLILYGLATFLITGNLFSGVWSVFLGWFLLSAARAEQSGALIRQALARVSVAEIMTPNPLQVADDTSVEDLLHQYVLGNRHSTFPIHNSQGDLTGLVTLAAIKKVPSGDRATTPASQIACRLDEVPVAAPQDPVSSLLTRLEGCSEGRALVVDGGRLVGIITPTDINQAVQRSVLSRRTRPQVSPG